MKYEFLRSASEPEHFPPHRLPEIALAGRSNVGKSSLLNRISASAKLARTSKRPGCTRTLNFFKTDENFSIVDLPGYGYAKVSQAERKQWLGVIDSYLQERDNVVGVVVVMDVNVPPSPLDLDMLRYAAELDLAVLPVATKTDKLTKAKRFMAFQTFKKALGPVGENVVFFSTETGEGAREIVSWMRRAACVQGAAD
ncbi:MAG: ribosome biogenesis GTP-binding protein YihA/YsxC [Myxococcota bacterium]|jgi:GTP-binding protein